MISHKARRVRCFFAILGRLQVGDRLLDAILREA